MSPNLRRLLLVAALLALGALVWLLVFGESGTSAGGAEREASAEIAARSSAEAPLTEEIPAGGRSPLPGAKTGEPETSDSSPPSLPGRDVWDRMASYLLVRVVSRKTRAPVEGVLVGLFRGFGGLSPEKTGPAGLAVLEVQANTPLHFWVQPPKKADVPDGGRRFFQDLDPLAAGEKRRIEVELPFPFDRRILGIVVAGSLGPPVPQARIQLREGDSVVQETHSGPNGDFELAARSISDTHLEVEASGMGPAIATLDGGAGSSGDPIVIPLERAASLQGGVIGPDGPQRNAEIVLEDRSTNGPRFPPWKAVTDPAGRYRIPGLPARVPLTVLVTLPGGNPREFPQPLLLEPGEERRADWDLSSLATLHGLVLGPEDAPVGGFPLVLRPASRQERVGLAFFHPPEFGEPGAVRFASDSEGRFLLKDLAPGKWTLGVDASRQLPALNGIPVVSQTLEIPPVTSEVWTTLRLVWGRFLSGAVFDPDGHPVFHAAVVAHNLEGKGRKWTFSREEGDFRIGPLLPGAYELEVVAHRQPHFRAPEPLRVEAGEKGIEIRLLPAAVLQGRVVDGRTGKPRAASITLASPGRHLGDRVLLGKDGNFELGGLEPGTYTLLAEGEGGGIGALFDLHADLDTPATGLRIELFPAAILVLETVADLPVTGYEVATKKGLLFWSELKPGSSDRFQVPPGTLTVTLLRDGKPFAHREVTVAAGDRKEIVFRGGD